MRNHGWSIKNGYYAYIKRLEIIMEKDIRDEEDDRMIKAAYEYKNWKKGVRQIKMRIERDFGVVMNLEKIRRLMKKYELVCPVRKANPVKAIMKDATIKMILSWQISLTLELQFVIDTVQQLFDFYGIELDKIQ